MVNLKSQLESLQQLQEVDSEIYRLTGDKNKKPAEIQDITASFEEKKAALASAEKIYLDAQKEKKDREIELAAKEESTKKLQGQLYQLKTNKEYNTMLQQIQDSKADASLAEDKILEAMDKIESAKKRVDEEKVKLSAEEARFSQQKKVIDDQVKEIEEKLAQLESRRKQLIPGIDPRIFSQYDRILKNRDGLAIAAVSNGTCKGCHMSVPPQVINRIQMYDGLITCEVCNRILYIPNE